MGLYGLHGFYTMQRDRDEYYAPYPMPAEGKEEDSYRKDQGNSIAVRINPSKDFTAIKLEDYLGAILFCPSVSVYFKGKIIGEDLREFVENPWVKEAKTFTLTKEEVDQIEEGHYFKFNDDIKIIILPIDLNIINNNNFKGQVLAVDIIISEEDEEGLIDYYEENNYDECLFLGLNIEFSPSNNVFVRLNFENPFIDSLNCKSIDLKNLKTLIEINEYLSKFREVAKFGFNVPNLILSHNGININLREDYELHSISDGFGLKSITDRGKIYGIILLKDSLRPNLSISRDKLVGLPWDFFSSAYLSFFKAIKSYKVLDLKFPKVLFRWELHYRYLFIENIFRNLDKEWYSIPMFVTDQCFYSINDLIEKVKGDRSIKIKNIFNASRGYSLVNYLSAVLTQYCLSLELRIAGIQYSYIIIDAKPDIHPNSIFFPPMFFVYYKESKLLQYCDAPLNRNHPFSQWLLDNAKIIKERYEGRFQYILKGLPFNANHVESSDILNINEILKWLYEFDNDITTPHEILLKEEDFKPSPSGSLRAESS